MTMPEPDMQQPDTRKPGPSHWPGPVRVIGIGSSAGDDALGWEVIGLLRAHSQCSFRHDLELHQVDSGSRLLDVLDGHGSLLIVDACAQAGNPGMVHRLRWPDDGIEILRPGSTHHITVGDALQLASVLGLLPARTELWGFEGEQFAPGAALSKSIAGVIGTIVNQIVAEMM